MRNTLMLLAVLLAIGCKNPAGIKVKPKALGAMNNIVVVSDEDIWASVVGDTIRDIFEGVYPITPRPEPIFDLRHFTPEALRLQPLKRELRTYLIVANLADTASPTTQMVKEDLGAEKFERARTDSNFNTSIGRGKWASGQIIIYAFANGIDQLTEAIVKNYNGISSRVNEHDAEILYQMTYARGENQGLLRDMQSRFGAEIVVPTDFQITRDSMSYDGMYWLSKEVPEGYIHMAIRQYDYTGPEMLTTEAVKRRFNQFGILITTDRPDAYVVATDQVLPILTYERQQGEHYLKEFRGIWETENDFFGGPFQSYCIVNEDARKLLSIDAFIFAPGRRKRDMMQQVDQIIKRIKW